MRVTHLRQPSTFTIMDTNTEYTENNGNWPKINRHNGTSIAQDARRSQRLFSHRNISKHTARSEDKEHEDGFRGCVRVSRIQV